MNEKKIRFIYWFAYYNLNSPSVRYRAKYPLEHFHKKYGIDFYLVVPGYSPSNIVSFVIAFFSALFTLKKDSIIVIQRVNSNFIYSNLLKLLVKFRKQDSIYDLDDADYLVKNSKTIYHFAKKCNTISAGSKKIAEHLSLYNSRIVNTTSPIVDLNIIKKRKSNIFTIGWIGGYGGEHKNSLINLIFPALRELDFNLRFILMGVNETSDKEFITNYFINKKNIQIETPCNIDWNDEASIQNIIKTFDIGIATLIDSEMQKSKSGIKAKQYLNNGVPVLSTNLPENDSVIIDGENGFFCSSAQDFKHRMIEFYKMTEHEYRYFSKNARSSINKFNHDRFLKSLIKIKMGHKKSYTASVTQASA